MIALRRRGDGHLVDEAGSPLLVVDEHCGHAARPTVVCDRCGAALTPTTTRVEAGPGGAAAPGTALLAERLATG